MTSGCSESRLSPVKFRETVFYITVFGQVSGRSVAHAFLNPPIHRLALIESGIEALAKFAVTANLRIKGWCLSMKRFHETGSHE
jgi:hypothetical protein